MPNVNDRNRSNRVIELNNTQGTNCLGVKLNMPETIISTSGSVV